MQPDVFMGKLVAVMVASQQVVAPVTVPMLARAIVASSPAPALFPPVRGLVESSRLAPRGGPRGH